MARIQTFDRDIRIVTEDLSPQAISAALAKFAKADLARVIETGEGTATFERIVNGRQGASEDSVIAPGPIVYLFSWWEAIIKVALTALVAASPRKTGRYASSFIVIVNGRVTTDFSNIEPSAEVIITNPQPYVRKIQVGAMQMSVPARMFERARSAISSKYTQKLVSVQVTFLNIESGVHPLIPYTLKGHSRSRRKDTKSGQPLTYPALVLNMVQ